MSEPRVSFGDLSARDIVDEILARVTRVEDCYQESEVGSQLIPALSALADHEIDGIGFELKSRFGFCLLCKEPRIKHLDGGACTGFRFGRCPDFSAAKHMRWWASIRAARAAQSAGRERHREPNGLPSIEVTDKPLRDLSAESLAALHAKNDPPSLFCRSGEMVHIATDEKGASELRTVKEDRLRGHMTRSADYLALVKESTRHIAPPIDIVRDILAYSPSDWGFPAVRGITEIPTIRPDGTVLDTPGYDAATCLYYASGSLEPLAVNPNPTRDDVRAAVACVDEAIGEFPYDSPASRANMFALLLTPVIRPAIDSCVPLAVLDAPQAGTGKGLLANVLSIIATGRAASMVPYQWREEEMQKQIASCLWAGRQMICFDNLEGDLRSANLCSAITAKFLDCRILGVSKNMNVENRATWLMTGNNVKPTGDMPRRCYQIRIDAGDPKPYESRTFRHPNLERWVTDNRAQLLHALITIARFWFSRGCPDPQQGKPWGSFEDWHRVMGGILRAAQVPGFLANRQTFNEEEDDSPREWELFLLEIDKFFPGESSEYSAWFTVQSVIEQLHIDTSRLFLARPSDIIGMMERGRKAPTIALGRIFQGRRGRRFGYSGRQVWLERQAASNEHKGSAMWRVRVCLSSEK